MEGGYYLCRDKSNNEIVERLVLDGKKIFQLMDSKGIPLEVIITLLQENDAAFNVVDFTNAAIESKNYSLEKIREKLVDSLSEEMRANFLKDFNKIFFPITDLRPKFKIKNDEKFLGDKNECKHSRLV